MFDGIPTTPDAGLIAACTKLGLQIDAYEGAWAVDPELKRSEAVLNALHTAYLDQEDATVEIAKMPAETDAGRTAKAGVLLRLIARLDETPAWEFARSFARDVMGVPA